MEGATGAWAPALREIALPVVAPRRVVHAALFLLWRSSMLALDNEIGLSSFATLAALCAGAALLAACGGKVVVDASGAGGGSVAVSATGVGGSSVGGSVGFTTAVTGGGAGG